MNLNVTVGRISRLDEDEILIRKQLPDAVGLITEGRRRFQGSGLITRS